MEFDTFLVGRTRTKEGGLSAIFFAAKSGNPDLIHYLVSKGGNVNERSNFGATPLMYAVSNNKIDTVKVLIDLQADVNARMNENLGVEDLRDLGAYSEIATAYRRAKKVGNPRILQALKEAGARP
jgi:ankyrin repeat protein